MRERDRKDGMLRERLFELEKSVILDTYQANKRNQVKTAAILGITRNTLRSRLLEYGVITEKPEEKQIVKDVTLKTSVKISFSK